MRTNTEQGRERVREELPKILIMLYFVIGVLWVNKFMGTLDGDVGDKNEDFKAILIKFRHIGIGELFLLIIFIPVTLFGLAVVSLGYLVTLFSDG